MSLLSQLPSSPGSRHYRKRVGRGRGSGLGQTSGKGHKGQLARSGGKVRRGFEGGQSPLVRRLPKFGFSNKKFETKYVVINVSQLQNFDGEVSPESIKLSGICVDLPVKILGYGKLTKKLSVKAHKFSESAKKIILAAGGSAEVIK